jgi:hypothetical protein
LVVTPVATGLDNHVDFQVPGEGSERFFILEQPGTILHPREWVDSANTIADVRGAMEPAVAG